MSNQTAPVNPPAAASPPRPMAVSTDLVAAVVWTILCDLLIYRCKGFNAAAAFFAIAWPLTLAAHAARRLGDRADRPRLHHAGIALLSVLLLATAARLHWSGHWLTILAGWLLLASLQIAASGLWPGSLRLIHLVVFAPLIGVLRLNQTGGGQPKAAAESAIDGDPSATLPDSQSATPPDSAAESFPPPSVAVAMPLVAAIVFGGIFIFANPDLLQSILDRLTPIGERFFTYLRELSPFEVVFCIGAFFYGLGFFGPRLMDRWMPTLSPGSTDPPPRSGERSTPLYAAYRNTLLTLIVVFSIYLPFEFATLWRRDFPTGFYYAGYAHQGALWLTIALGIATALLSWIFGPRTQSDSRAGRLRGIARVWSALNLLLAAAVYNRLLIYVGYNGMTRMRTVGLFGITLVVIGFGLVVYKIAQRRSFLWLVRGQLTAVMLVLVIYSVFPVDYVAHRYNALRVSGGNLRPSVMIAVKPIDDEGYLNLPSLINHPDLIIRAGVRAMLAQRAIDIHVYVDQEPWSWQRHQGAKTYAYAAIWRHRAALAPYFAAPYRRAAAIDRFRTYAMQWY